MKPATLDPEPLLRAIAALDTALAIRLLAASPALATTPMREGATRLSPKPFFLDDVARYLVAGDTALHLAAATYRVDVARPLIAAGASVRARNRLGAEPLHAAAVGSPGSARWNPDAQAAMLTYLVQMGADPNATDKKGVTALHRAVRTRCAAAVRALLALGADPGRPNGNGSTPLHLARHTTGKAGSGSPAAREQQAEIVLILERANNNKNKRQ
jgi:ankyrin repeat protein